MVYCADGVSFTKVLMFNSRTGQWTVLPECHKEYFSIAVVRGKLTAIGGKQSYKATNTLLILPQDRPGIFQQKWIEQFPPMTYRRNAPAVATTNTSLIVAGGWGPDDKKAPVEVIDILTLQWSTVASLPLPLWNATATICGDRLYIGGGLSSGWNTTKSVVMCEVKDLFQSQSQSLAIRPGLPSSPPVWKEVAPLPVELSSLVTFQGQLLAVGGGNPRSTSDVMQYDATTNSWSVISHMKMKRRYCLAAVLPNNTLMVCGDIAKTTSVEIASV
ncbi:Kelch-like protein 9 [Geodia barretti]|uniref:Kelch-like protein 9 n=1 Tax=Geodia barretti TaxID=519541 RepID=A0AA35R1X3_GEOBA|nr:Kelch-like protein 9 [Geodia barretti]